MSIPVVFYSWQSDLPRLTSRDVIHSAAAIAIERIAGRVALEDAPRLDHDTLGESGAPPITETIFRKIRDSAVVLADVSFVGHTEPREGQKRKLLPNPNVLIELGYAAATIGWGRILLVMNKHYGSPEHLPFDLKDKRFPITFSMAPNSSKPAPTEDLAADLETAIRLHLTNEYTRVEDTLARLSPYARKMLYDFGGSPSFHPMKVENKIVSLEDLAILQFIELGIIVASPAPTDAGFVYRWTYLGRQCISRLGVCLPPPAPPVVLPQFPEMTLNTSWYDRFLSRREEPAPDTDPST
jgi:hypothetical protein